MWASSKRLRGGPDVFPASCVHEKVDVRHSVGVWADGVQSVDRGRHFLVRVTFQCSGGAVGGNFGRTQPGLFGWWYMTPARSCARAPFGPSDLFAPSRQTS
ncbi:hypothetical protein NDU88_005829 [Pleurodeles waltl]|uniref:Uncharacterized protein n=1 Tax=Pleurodeles waltl TaxID=8319 RepID=A0AAV7WZD4_PLEWA|nr:hypothetical protein NDU88_005829 [Pleurodeles waltl]